MHNTMMFCETAVVLSEAIETSEKDSCLDVTNHVKTLSLSTTNSGYLPGLVGLKNSFPLWEVLIFEAHAGVTAGQLTQFGSLERKMAQKSCPA